MADSILTWNAIALEANRISHTDNSKRQQTGPPLSSRALAIVHLAMYDAYAGVINDPANLPTYLPTGPVPANSTTSAAVAAAAYTALGLLYSQQQSDFDQALADHGDQGDPGHQFGVDVAQAIYADRAADPDAGSAGYSSKPERGKHRVDPDNPGQGFHAAYYGARSRGFAITQRHELMPPPFDDGAYTQALRQVRAKGIMPELAATLPNNLFGDRRVPDETLIGIFWAYDGAAGLGTPPRFYNQIVRRVAQAQGNSEADNARLFALVNVALADAGILAWDQKYIHEFWRPVLGVREHDKSFGPGATESNDNISDVADPFWLPLGAPSTNSMNEAVLHPMSEFPCPTMRTATVKNFTPNFPAYPSGHATFGAAALHVTRLFYGVTGKGSDHLFDGLDIVSEELNGEEPDDMGRVRPSQDNKGTVRLRHRREFDGGLWQMIIENGLSRIYLGVHWSFDAFSLKNGKPNLTKNIGGVPLGLKIAEDIFQAAGAAKAPKKSPVEPRA